MDSNLQKNGTSTETALQDLLGRARLLIDDGLAPRRSLGGCLRALGPILTFIHGQPALRGEPSLSPDVGRALLRIAQELDGLPGPAQGSELPSPPPLSVPLPLSVEHEEAIRTGVLLLGAYRAAVERGAARGLSPQLRAEFGIGDELRTRDGAAVADGIARFLAAAVRFPAAVTAAGLSGRQLGGLAAQERVLRAHLAQRRQQAVTPGLPQRLLLLHLALETFYDRFEAALGARLWSDPTARLAGMRLLPGLLATGRRSGGPSPAYRACQLTDSGRLIFT